MRVTPQSSLPARPGDEAARKPSTSRLGTVHNGGPDRPRRRTTQRGRITAAFSRTRRHPAVKFRVERDVLAESVAWAARSLPSRPSVPILAGLLIEAEEGQITLSGFDYETSVRVTVPAQVADTGRCLVSGRLVADISRSLPDLPVDVSVDGAKAVLTCGTSRFTLQTLPTDEYPALPDMPTAAGTVPSDVFAQAVSQVVTAAGREDTLPVLTGVRVEIEGTTISLLATDRYRLAVRELEWNPQSPDASAAALVPARVRVETAHLVEAVKRVALVAERNAPVRLTFSEDTVTLDAGSGDEAQASESLEAKGTGDDVTVGFNPTYLLDGLGAIGTPYAHLAFTQATKPAELTGAPDLEADTVTDFRYVLMPVRLNS